MSMFTNERSWHPESIYQEIPGLDASRFGCADSSNHIPEEEFDVFLCLPSLDDTWLFRSVAIEAIRTCHMDGEGLVEVLIELLGRDDKGDQMAAACALGAMGAAGAKGVSDLTRVLRAGGSLSVRYAILHALAEFGPEALPALPELMEVVRRGYRDDPTYAANALAAIGPAAAGAVPALQEMRWTHRFRDTRRAIAAALAAIGGM
jgi:HEAT repeat protein